MIQIVISFGSRDLDSSLNVYNKETIGSDIWKPSEIRGSPMICKDHLSSTVQRPLRAVSMPHQLLRPLNALLGKPNEKLRTVCKTPVLYRVTLRNNESVRK